MEPVSMKPNTVMNISNGYQPVRKLTPAEAQNSFKVALSDALNNVNKAQHASALATEKLARGENIDLHQVMITAQKSSISLQATIEVRNKIVEAYQEVMRMQV
ncbi:flagellar hook-basal body complex protein FliE [Anaerobacillus alkaliphilus]|uniref:Flagellar hook-basal body complex protein FliE n=1 Tax=Anaerobacillus alkaliphilus TaxID=1548597 RepID=A0A4Q0VPK5_9BACI|nr:flagellar hook-basal body complex protein FliE [Anaerobacillus alkaliphilus]RXI98011.1 flagellar hook-basal body complex protein FliE [Anaerobacillus alkaliphilus]